MSLRIKIILLFLAGSLIGAGYVFQYWLPKAEQESVKILLDSTQRELDSISEMLVAPILQNQFSLIHENLVVLVEKHPSWVSIELISMDGQRLFPISAPPEIENENQQILRNNIFFRNTSMGTLNLIVDFRVQIEALKKQSLQLVGTLFAGFLLILLVIVFFVDTFISRPVIKLSDAAERLAGGDYKSKLPPAGKNEVGTLITKFSIMRANIQNNAEKLQQNEQQFRDFGAAASDWYWEMDENLRFSYFSDSFFSITGVSQDLLLGKTREENGNPGAEPEAWQEHLETLANHHPFRNFTHPRTLPDGKVVWLSINGKPVFDHNGIFRGYRGAGLDITEIKNTQDDLLQAKNEAEIANRAKTQFLSSMSHELRTPMNAILGFGQMLGLNLKEPLSENQKVYVDHIMKGGNHLLELIDQVLDLAKIEVGEMSVSIEEIALDTTCVECLDLIDNSAKDRSLSISSTLSATHSIKADYTRFKQILLNLLSNAVKYNGQGGHVFLTTKDTSDDMVRVSVTDTGPGIAENAQSGLFEPFNRLGREASEIEGTGIGLTITKQLVEAMGGQIGFESTVGKGSTFWVEFPAIETTDIKQMEEVQALEKDEHSEQLSAANTVLYIEDNIANLHLMKEIIDKMGSITLISAENAELGMAIAEEQLPDLILMDINLPGMDGIAATQALAQINTTKNIPVIAVSAAAMECDVNRAKNAGFKAYLTKPFNVPELVGAIKKELGG